MVCCWIDEMEVEMLLERAMSMMGEKVGQKQLSRVVRNVVEKVQWNAA